MENEKINCGDDYIADWIVYDLNDFNSNITDENEQIIIDYYF